MSTMRVSSTLHFRDVNQSMMKSSSPTATAANESTTQKSGKRVIYIRKSSSNFHFIRHIYSIYQRVTMHGVPFYNKQKSEDVNVVKQHRNILVVLSSV